MLVPSSAELTTHQCLHESTIMAWCSVHAWKANENTRSWTKAFFSCSAAQDNSKATEHPPHSLNNNPYRKATYIMVLFYTLDDLQAIYSRHREYTASKSF